MAGWRTNTRYLLDINEEMEELHYARAVARNGSAHAAQETSWNEVNAGSAPERRLRLASRSSRGKWRRVRERHEMVIP